MRWSETEGEAACPSCGCPDTYDITLRRRFKCVASYEQFSVTSGMIFVTRKLSFTDLLAAIVIFLNGAKGVSALQVSRDLESSPISPEMAAHNRFLVKGSVLSRHQAAALVGVNQGRVSEVMRGYRHPGVPPAQGAFPF